MHTQEAQQNSNKTEGFGDFNIGEIDDEDLLLAEESCSSNAGGKGNKSDSDDYVNSEGNVDNYHK